MNLNLLAQNLASYSLQIGLLIAVAAAIPVALRLAHPRSRLAFWHILLICCIFLPLLAPWRSSVSTANVQVTTAPATIITNTGPAVTRPVPWNALLLGLLAGGIAVRLAWIGIGLLRLRMYRRRAVPLCPPVSWGVEADLRVSTDVTSPVTFGFLHPVVLLPAGFPEFDAAAQDAILCHEILHVRRKDWLVAICEELVRAVFWFHPAIWWLLGEIGLAREQAVDREVIELTRARDEYVDALLAIAGARPQMDLAPAPLFLRKRHLKQRVVSIMKEVRMSKTRSATALAAAVFVLAGACWLVALTFPLAAAPQTIADEPGVSVDLGGAAIQHRTTVPYPRNARTAKIEGTVLVEATLDSAGNVADAKVLSGPTELRRGVLQSVLQWHFSNDTGANTRQIRVTFTTPPEASVPAMHKGSGTPGTTVEAVAPRAGVVGSVPGGTIGGIIGAVPTAQSMAGKTLTQVRILGLTDEAKARLMSKLPVRQGDILATDSFERTTQAVRDFDEHMIVGTARDKEGNVSFVITAPGGASVGYAFTASEPSPNVPGRINVGGNAQSVKLVQQPRPVYPPLAKQARISGVVKFSVIIAKDGTVADIKVISGHPLLIPAALDSVRNWVYQPTLLNGTPVEVQTQIDVNFTLADEIPQQQQQ
jgi:TonB family protein